MPHPRLTTFLRRGPDPGPGFCLGPLLMVWVLALAISGCSDSAGHAGGGGTPLDLDPPLASVPTFSTSVEVLDEDGDPLPSAVVTFASPAPNAALFFLGGGRFQITQLDQPVLLQIEAPGFLTDLITVDRIQAAGDISIRLLARTAPGGDERTVLHFGGDVMLGRRYIEPTSSQTAQVFVGDGGVSARAVVSSLAPLMAAADLRSLNLETVVGNFALDEAYPKKRFLLQSPPEVIHALDELQTSVVTLGNNHLRDWLDIGVSATTGFLDAGGLPWVGAGVDEVEASEGLLLDLGTIQVGVLSYTSVNGDFVNDSLPDDSDPEPAHPPSEDWQYEFRTFSFTGPTVTIPEAARRIGSAWNLIEDAEDTPLSPMERADLWTAAVAVYPELQDWVARRGHGGANPYDRDRLGLDIAALQGAGADVVVVQFHSGFQFAEVKSSFIEFAAHRSIDEGADMVICHHPHVLQGLEWYKDKLIAYSLGNLVFDQDFLATFPTMIVRVVLEGTDIHEVRLYPVVIDRYRPVPLGGRAAEELLQMVHERSVMPRNTKRVNGVVRMVDAPFHVEADPPHLVLERGTARVEMTTPPPVTENVTITFDSITPLDGPALTRARGPAGAPLFDVLLGRELFRFGNYEDEGADGQVRGGIHWIANDPWKRIDVGDDSPSGVRRLRLRRFDGNGSITTSRSVARIQLSKHRFYEEVFGDPIDAEAFFSVRVRARRNGTGQAFVRFDVYHFDDTNPTADPESLLLRRRDLDLDIPNDGEWHEILLDIPLSVLADAGPVEANSVLLYLALEPPAQGITEVFFDDLEVYEWRIAQGTPDGFYDIDAVRAATPGAVLDVELERSGD